MHHLAAKQRLQGMVACLRKKFAGSYFHHVLCFKFVQIYFGLCWKIVVNFLLGVTFLALIVRGLAWICAEHVYFGLFFWLPCWVLVRLDIPWECDSLHFTFFSSFSAWGDSLNWHADCADRLSNAQCCGVCLSLLDPAQTASSRSFSLLKS